MLLFLSLITVAISWGRQGHQITGIIAQRFLTPQAQELLNRLFPESKGQIAPLTTWADEVRGTPAFAWTANLHYINPRDRPPSYCEYVDSRDCPTGRCVVGAIGNYTDQARCTRSDAVRQTAIKFLFHFIGDLAQPLHACGRDRGGNDASVIFNGSRRNMHQIWDTQIPVQRMDRDFRGSIDVYAQFLINAISTGPFSTVRNEWLYTDIFERTTSGNSVAAVKWTNDSNGFNCNTVWGPYVQNPNQDLAFDYYEDVYRVADLQLAKAGYRLADTLNKIAAC
jgi:hypothetical protein